MGHSKIGNVKRSLLVAVSIAAATAAAAGAQTIPAPSPALVDVLAAARASDMPGLVAWAQHQSAPAASSADITPIATKILALAPGDRDALLYWLDAHGRGALHAQGASDRQIGIPYYPLDYTIVPAPLPGSVTPLVIPPPPTPQPTAAPQHHSHGGGLLGLLLPSINVPVASSSSSSTSTTTSQNGNATEIDQTTQSSSSSVSVGVNPAAVLGSLIDAAGNTESHPSSSAPPWRSLRMTASPFYDPAGPVSVTSAFAATRNDNASSLACIGFTNASAKPITRVDVDVEVLNGLGLIKNVQQLRRVGSVAPGGHAGGDLGPQSDDERRANCVSFSGATALAYSVREVYFDDGTTWLAPGANAWGP